MFVRAACEFPFRTTAVGECLLEELDRREHREEDDHLTCVLRIAYILFYHAVDEFLAYVELRSQLILRGGKFRQLDVVLRNTLEFPRELNAVKDLLLNEVVFLYFFLSYELDILLWERRGNELDHDVKSLDKIQDVHELYFETRDKLVSFVNS